MNLLKSLAWILAGIVLGGAAGIGVAWGAGAFSRWRHPEDPSAFSAADMVIATFPLGVFLGLMAGLYCAMCQENRRRASRGFAVASKPGDRGSGWIEPRRGSRG
jgi:hypothetical protein